MRPAHHRRQSKDTLLHPAVQPLAPFVWFYPFFHAFFLSFPFSPLIAMVISCLLAVSSEWQSITQQQKKCKNKFETFVYYPVSPLYARTSNPLEFKVQKLYSMLFCKKKLASVWAGMTTGCYKRSLKQKSPQSSFRLFPELIEQSLQSALDYFTFKTRAETFQIKCTVLRNALWTSVTMCYHLDLTSVLH